MPSFHDQQRRPTEPPACSVEPEWVDRQVAGELGLSVGQVVVLTRLAQGWTHERIARAVDMSPGSVRNRAVELFARLEAHNAAEAVAKAYDSGLLRTRAARVEAARAAGLQVAS